MKVKELIKILSKYEPETEICSGYICKNKQSHYDLIIKETNCPFNRDFEDDIELWLGFEDNELFKTYTEEDFQKTIWAKMYKNIYR